jgi:S-adenosylmethionine/arginine decarboxylase-like enzyme
MSVSPLWRGGFYRCYNQVRLSYNDEKNFDLRKSHLDDVLRHGGLKLVRNGEFIYSTNGAHGYTYFAGLMQSGVMIHTYPEPDFLSATVNIETCEGPETMTPIIDRVFGGLTLLYGAEFVIRRDPGDSRDLPLRTEDAARVWEAENRSIRRTTRSRASA